MLGVTPLELLEKPQSQWMMVLETTKMDSILGMFQLFQRVLRTCIEGHQMAQMKEETLALSLNQKDLKLLLRMLLQSSDRRPLNDLLTQDRFILKASEVFKFFKIFSLTQFF